MKVTTFGMGYVGCVTAACLANHGHDVTGVDVDGNKVEMINHSQSPIIEPGLPDIIKKVVNAGELRATTETSELEIVSSLRWYAEQRQRKFRVAAHTAGCGTDSGTVEKLS